MDQTSPNPIAPIPAPAPLWRRACFWQLTAGVVFLVAAVLVSVLLTAPIGGWRRAQAKVEMIDQYAYSLTFPVENGTHVYVKRSNVPIRDVRDGQTLYFRYRADDPDVVVPYTDAIVLGALLGVAGLLLVAVASSIWHEERKTRARWARVRRDGVPVQATVLNVYNDYTGLTKAARRRYSRLDCAYYPTSPAAQQRESGQASVWLFTSERFYRPVSKFEGNVTVYVVPSAPDDYFVDLTSLTVLEVHDAPDSPADDAI